MFFIFGIDSRKGGEVTACDSNGRRYSLFYVGNCFSLFFIPIFTFGKVYYISVGNCRREITREQYIEIKTRGIVPECFMGMEDNGEFRQAYEAAGYSGYSQSEEGTYAGGICPICKKEVDESFAYCPHCGQKRPRA